MTSLNHSVLYSVRGLTKRYGARTVLNIDHLEVRRGEVLALVGPSGAGKSTLLRMLNFLETPTTGVVEFQGVEFSVEQPAPLALRRQVTTVFQRPALLQRSVYDNVAYGLRVRGNRDGQELIMGTLAQLGLGELARQAAPTLSGGEAQRVALARAVVLQPAALLLDEPTANLDPYNVGLLESIIGKLNREQGTTMVVVTHNVFQARRLAHRVAFVFDGALVEVADVERFFEAPADPRTAAFVRGDMVY